MQRIAYILKDNNGQPYSPNGAVAARGFALLGYEVRFFSREELITLPLEPGTPVIGGMGTVIAALRKLEIEPPRHATMPACLLPFAGRDCWSSTIGEVRETRRFPVFVKPLDDTKRFTGLVLRTAGDIDAIPLCDGQEKLPDDYAVQAQTPVNFLSEWRVFVVRGRVAGTCHHSGDPLLFPNAGVIRQAIGAFVTPLQGYSTDFGVVEDGRTLLVEINEGYALICGHLKASAYAELLLARWTEMASERV